MDLTPNKLNGLAPIYYLNLDGQPERRKYMENQFKHWAIDRYTRIASHDGRNHNLREIIDGKYPEDMTSTEIGCVTSHLKALKHWMETSESSHAIIMEDDVDLQVVKYWSFSWMEFYSRIPYDWDVVQLGVTFTGPLYVALHKRFVNDFSTASYMITRHHAEKLLKHHTRGNRYKLDNGVKPRAVADDLIYNSGNTYSIALFSYEIALGSSIHPDHIDAMHRRSREGLAKFWMQNGPDLKIEQLMNYDPYLGRASESPPAWFTETSREAAQPAETSQTPDPFWT